MMGMVVAEGGREEKIGCTCKERTEKQDEGVYVCVVDMGS